MKIAVDCRMVGSSGIGVYIEELLPHFVKNYECFLFGNEKNLIQYKDSAQIFNCNIKPFSFNEIFSFPKTLLKEINQCSLYYTPYCNIPGGVRVPIFSTIHDIVFLDVNGLTSTFGKIARKFFYWHAIKKSKTLFTVSEFSKSRIQKHFNCKNLPIVVTYSALSQKLVDAKKSFFENDKSFQKKNQILYVGNIKKHKGLSTLLDAFSLAQKNGLDAKLIIVGSAKNFRTKDDSIFSKIENLPEDKIQFTGFISNEELFTLYASSRLLVQPSLYEGFGLPPLEAMWFRTRALISDIPVFKEVYKDFPVVFFESENEKDLAQKMISCMNDFSALPQFNNPYSFEKTYNIIINAFP